VTGAACGLGQAIAAGRAARGASIGGVDIAESAASASPRPRLPRSGFRARGQSSRRSNRPRYCRRRTGGLFLRQELRLVSGTHWRAFRRYARPEAGAAGVARASWSMPPDHGAAVVRLILEDDAPAADWRAELNAMRQRIARGALAVAHPPRAARAPARHARPAANRWRRRRSLARAARHLYGRFRPHQHCWTEE
jgi:hypothetical protein